MRDNFSQTLIQLVTISPILLVYLGAVCLSVANWKRSPTPSMLTLIASSVLLVLAIGQPILFRFIIAQRQGMGGNAQQLQAVIASFSVFTSIVHALGLGTLVVAVFVGRDTGRDRSDSSAWE